MLWTGRIMSALPALLLLLSAAMKLAKSSAVVEGFAHGGIPESLIIKLGILELVCTVIYIIPQTSVLGAIDPVNGLYGWRDPYYIARWRCVHPSSDCRCPGLGRTFPA